ncbi:MAG: hypothetical protein HeimC2_11450 [Candidatus Heimdallarchaeota archaeon LC_2]|nr:MAG: hypothetical protein HeimC2_11450 [Candidatus Heimdallarchaeota archaeon LC_2]
MDMAYLLMVKYFLKRRKTILLLILLLWLLTNSFFILTRSPSIFQIAEYQRLKPVSPNFYVIDVYASQWAYSIVNRYDKISEINKGIDEFEVIRQLDLGTKIAFEAGSKILIYFYSRDTQHRLLLEKLEFQLISKRPEPGQLFSIPVSDTLEFPLSRGIYNSVEGIFQGLGTDDMVITYYNGEPRLTDLSFEFSKIGPLLAYGLINLLVLFPLIRYYWKRASRIEEKSIDADPEH